MAHILQNSDITEVSQLTHNTREWVYNALDVCVTYEVRDALAPLFDTTTRKTYELSKSLQAPVLDMSMRGILVDERNRAETLAKYREQIAMLEERLTRIVRDGIGLDLPPKVFNKSTGKWTVWWRSPQRLMNLFYDILGLTPVKKRSAANGRMMPTINREALEKLSVYFIAEPLCAHILALRDLDKKRSFLETGIDPDGRMRCNFNIAGTNTGRLASSLSDFGTGGNLQNIDRDLRYTFVADPGYVFVNLDGEQADARNVGAVCWNLFLDKHGPEFAGAYLDACESGDLHTTVCKMAWRDLNWGDDPSGWRRVADVIAYRADSYRQLAKKLGHGCLTADHEVLTPEGWVPISSQPSIIMQWEPGKSSFTAPSHWEAKPYTGILQVFTGTSVQAKMTHDHRVPYVKDNSSAILHEKPAEAGPGKFMPLGDGWIGGMEEVPAKLIAAFMADGHQETNWMAFHFHKNRKAERLIALCQAYGYEYRIHGDKIRVRGHLPKRPGAFMFNWSGACIRHFVEELKYWDGTISKSSVSISSTRREDLVWFQTFGRLVGVGGNISQPYTSGFGSTVYRLQQNNRKYASGSSVKHSKHPVENVMVYCPTVETGWFYVRHNGRIFVTGNTNYYGQPKTMAKHTKVQTPIIQEFQHRYFEAFPAIPLWHKWVSEQLRSVSYITSLMGRRRSFFGRGYEDETLREAIAYCGQSPTADEIDTGILQIWRAAKRFDAQLLVQVHDSILLQVPVANVNDAVPELVRLMHAPILLAGDREFVVPIEAKVGFNWGDYDPSKPELNPDGLRKWKGKLAVERQHNYQPKRKLSILDL